MLFKPQKIVEMMGGLGNQMFQYAFFIKLSKVSNCNCGVDISFFDDNICHNGYELERVFNIQIPKADLYECFVCGKKNKIYRSNIINRIKYKLFYKKHLYTIKNSAEASEYYPRLLSSSYKYYSGYWSNELYFKDIRDEILDAFQFVNIDSRNVSISNEMQQSNSVSLHIRRGDYLKKENNIYWGICNEFYYDKAINFIRENVVSPVFYVFSNDIDWCRKNMKLDNVVYIDWNNGKDSYKDMYLMSQCKHNIVANSSFSWWGGYLNRFPYKIVCAPRNFLNIKKSGKGEFPDNWIRFDNRAISNCP